MEIIQATLDDIGGILKLMAKYHVSTIAEEDKADGFVTTQMSAQQMEDIILKEKGITIAKKDGEVVCFAMAGSWEFWSQWPLFQHMIGALPKNQFNGTALSKSNSYQYGPICVDSSVQGTGVFEAVFKASLASMADRYPIMVTFINQINGRSHKAHTQKAGMEVISTFQFNNNDYYMLACATEK